MQTRNIPDILDELGIPHVGIGQHEHAREGWEQIDCPYCSPGLKRFRLGINLKWGNSNCWTCGPHRTTDVIAESAKITPRAAYLLLATVPRNRAPRVERPVGTLKMPSGVTDLTNAHRKYLKSRHLDPDEIAQLWGIRGIGIAPRLKWRLFIPVLLRGEIVSWTTRSISPTAHVRYLSAKDSEEAIPHKSLLYGEDFCRNAIVVVEGPIDAWTIGPGAVATFGTGCSKAQLNRIAAYPYRVLCFDNEATAQRRAEAICANLSAFPGRTINVTLDAKDANSASKKEIKLLRKMVFQ